MREKWITCKGEINQLAAWWCATQKCILSYPHVHRLDFLVWKFDANTKAIPYIKIPKRKTILFGVLLWWSKRKKNTRKKCNNKKIETNVNSPIKNFRQLCVVFPRLAFFISTFLCTDHSCGFFSFFEKCSLAQKHARRIPWNS